jgi:hypothetical protein
MKKTALVLALIIYPVEFEIKRVYLLDLEVCGYIIG